MSNKVEMPQLLKQLMEWEKEIAPTVPDLETPLGYYLSFNVNDNGNYACSPADSIMFANTGMDGVHYSLLTDFGSVSDLSKAPVICVSPMDFGNQVRIVAENILDFFTLSLLGHRDLLFNDFPTKEAYQNFLQEQKQELEQQERQNEKRQEGQSSFSLRRWLQQQSLVGELAKEKIQLQQIADPFNYIARIRKQRAAQTVLSTSEGLGVIGFPVSGAEKRADSNAQLEVSSSVQQKQPTAHPWTKVEIPVHKTEEIEDYLAHAELPGLLSFVRDYQQQYVTNDKLLRKVCHKLEEFGLELESRRLLHCMPSSEKLTSGEYHVTHHIVWHQS